MNNQAYKWIIRLVTIILIVLATFLIGKLLVFLKPVFILIGRIILPFLISAIIAYIFHPIVRFLEKKNFPRSLSILFIYAVFLTAFAFLIFKGTPYILNEGEELVEQLPIMAETYGQFAQEIQEKTEVLPTTFQDKVSEWFENGEAIIADYVSKIGIFFKQLVDWFLLIIVIPFIVFYLLKDMSLVKKVVWYLTPHRLRKDGIKLTKAIDDSLGKYIRGQLFVCVVVGALSYIGLMMIEMPYALLLAVFIALTNVIPYFGPIIAIFPVVLIALTESFQLVIYALIIIFAVQIIEGNLIAPFIVGKSIRMHPVLIIFALIVGGELAGIIGLILSVPILTVIKVILLHIRREIREKNGVYY